MPHQIKNSTVIIAPLDWGLGHATRCIPIIKTLLNGKNRCIIASSGRSLELLKQEFPTLEFEEIPSYNITYGKNTFSTFFKLLVQIPKSLVVKSKEQSIANALAEKYNANVIISDNRFGMYSSKCKSIFITHQVRVRLPLVLRPFEFLFFQINKAMILKFDECWIPDYNGSKNISGILSHSWTVPNSYFIGPLSAREQVHSLRNYDVVAILSGPEPQRGIFEAILCRILPTLPYSSCLVRGVLAAHSQSTQVGNCVIQTFATNYEINQLLSGAKIIISRAGYSSIMDYEKLHLKAILVPTPGQTEQEYLGNYLREKTRYWTIAQNRLHKQLPKVLHEILEQTEKTPVQA
ncbi:MAG: glycosyltransferase [Bacteroidetes bacterium]|nr:glycosyltransferase [Bacteroidota bacterium]